MLKCRYYEGGIRQLCKKRRCVRVDVIGGCVCFLFFLKIATDDCTSKFLNYITPSPSREDPGDAASDTTFLSPYIHYNKNMLYQKELQVGVIEHYYISCSIRGSF